MDALQKELSKIKVTLPDLNLPSKKRNISELPNEYKSNNAKEKVVLSFAENFRRQFVHLYRDRKPLLLNPVNECGTEKFICSYVRPTLLSYKELYDYDSCAQFVSDYLTFESLDPAIDLPSNLCSSTTVLTKQTGNSFEFSILLCSLLIGAGYDAYCVCGYATREVTLMDETREICPLLKKKNEVSKEQEKKEMKKYSVKPPKDLRSKFEAKIENKKLSEEEEKERKRKEEEDNKIVELEKPKLDKLHGLRVHCWVLVLCGKREVPESFFIESLTGTAHPLNHLTYLGIESVWNNKNYWVNMQDCSNGVQDLVYDLGDPAKWEFMFPGSDKPLLNLPTLDDEPLDLDDEENEEEPSDFDLPPSWVLPIELSLKDFQTKCPYGKKTKLYKKAKLEKFAEYLLKDGLFSRLSINNDYELNDLLETREVFRHRADKLDAKTHNITTGSIVECFVPGRPDCLQEHIYKASSPGPETDRTMKFYSSARIDGLVKREESPEEMTETFVDRDDFLYYRHVTFGKRVKKFGPQDTSNSRPIVKIVERFHRDQDQEAHEDVAERVFLIADERINLTFHLEDNRVTASTREFVRPPSTAEKGGTLTMTPDMTTSFQVDPLNKPPKNLTVYDMLVFLVDAEEKSVQQVRVSEEEVKEILQQRIVEVAAPQLSVSVYDTERNEKAKLHRQDLERKQREDAMKEHETELDYLAPFLAQIGDPSRISRQEAFKLKEECLQDLKQRLIDKANLIQARFEKETQELQRKQSWYQQNQVSMTKEDEEEYLNYCSEAMFRIHILEQRLNRHKEMAPQKYMQLEHKLRNDPRLSEYF